MQQYVPYHQKPRQWITYAVTVIRKFSDVRIRARLTAVTFSGLLNSPQPAGSKCIPALFAWLADYLGKDQKGSFFPFDWKLRVNAGRQQASIRGDCGIYATTHAMCLAFGYGIRNRNGGIPRDHQAKFISRRRRYVQDLLHRGFAVFDPEPNATNWQYYPLIDRKPTASKSEGFFDIPADIIDKLPTLIARQRSCKIVFMPQAHPYCRIRS